MPLVVERKVSNNIENHCKLAENRLFLRKKDFSSIACINSICPKAYLSNFRYFPKIYLFLEFPVLLDNEREGGDPGLLIEANDKDSSFDVDWGVYADGT